MSTPENIVRFNEVTATMLLHLYNNFPNKVSFELATLFPDTEITQDENSGAPIFNIDARFVSSCIEWLIQAGYISGQVNPLKTSNLVLTAKGLELLKLVPSSLENTSFGDELVKASKSGTKETLINVASSLLTTGITTLYHSMK